MSRTIRTTDEFKVEVVNGANTSNLTVSTTSGGTKTLTFDGDLEILGTSTEIQSTQLNIEDNLISLSRTNSGGADVDAGILIDRGSAGNDALFYWNEGDDKFKAVLSTSGGSATSVTDSSFATIVANFESAGSNAITISDNLISTGSSNADINLRPHGTGKVVMDNVSIDGESGVIATDSSNQNITLTPHGTGTVITNDIQIGTGNDLLQITGTGGNGATLATTSSNADINIAPHGSGKVVFDKVLIDDNVIATKDSNADLELSANGTGKVVIDRVTIDDNTITANTSNANLELSGNGTGLVSINNAYTLPAADGSANQILKSDGSGTLSFADQDTITVATTMTLVATNTTDASHFLVFTDTATGNENPRTDTGLTYNPSSNTLTTGAFTSSGSNGITVADNLISTGSSNADININPHGTGKVVMDRLTFDDATISTTESNEEIVLDPHGSAGVVVNGSLLANQLFLTGTSGLQMEANEIVTIGSNQDIIVRPAGTGRLVIDNVAIQGDSGLITTESSNMNLTVNPHGTGIVVVNSTTQFGEGNDLLQIAPTGGNGPTISTTSSNADINITPHGTGATKITGPVNITNDSTDDTLLITSTENSSTAAPVITLKRNSGSTADADYLGEFKFKGENGADEEVTYARITGKILDESDGTEDGIIEFANIKAGSEVITARLRSDGYQLLNGSTLTVNGATTLESTLDVTSAAVFGSTVDVGVGNDELRIEAVSGQGPKISTTASNSPITISPHGTGFLDVAGGLVVSETDTISGSGSGTDAVSLSTVMTFLDTSSGTSQLTMGAGTKGQIKIITMTVAGNAATMTTSNGNLTPNISTSLVWDAVGETASFIYTGSKWAVLSRVDVTSS
tara:strand:+ start:762 stop:3353 length:2592 start_codon:yes stop_codon:yes gene_type:complete